ncbi:MAG: InlB B-repeat-containing protein [Kiritimatiellae bacterium]|nr:InlB B-repeat-containing protein [Kiritimatiellia bacterium]
MTTQKTFRGVFQMVLFLFLGLMAPQVKASTVALLSDSNTATNCTVTMQGVDEQHNPIYSVMPWVESSPRIRFESRAWAEEVRSAASADPTVVVMGGRLGGTTPTWTSDKTFLVMNSVYVPSGVTLTIQAGTVVKFCPGTFIKIEDGGALNIVGAEGQDVILTAANDNTVGSQIVGFDETPITFGGIVIQSSAASFSENGYVQTRGFKFGNFPTLTLNNTTAFASGGVARIPVTLNGVTREKIFSIDWVAEVDGEAFTSGKLTWSKTGEGTKTIEVTFDEAFASAHDGFTIRVVAHRGCNVSSETCAVTLSQWVTLPIVTGMSESAAVVYEARGTATGKLVRGEVTLGELKGGAATQWDTTGLLDGWQTATVGTNATELLVLNDATIAIEGGRLAADTTWDNTVTHLVRNSVYVPSGKTLTITAGTVVKFGEGTFIKVEDGGKLTVVGAAGQDVIFTPANDNTVGTTVPGLGDETITYGGVWVQSGSATYTDNSYVQLRGFNYGSYPTLTLNDATLFATDGVAYLPVTLNGVTRNAAFSIEWEAVVDGEVFQTGALTWSKTGDGTKIVEIPFDRTFGEAHATFTVRIVTHRACNVGRGEATVTLLKRETLALATDIATSPAARYEGREGETAAIVRGEVTLGEPEGGAATQWDTTGLLDGWQTATVGESDAELLVLNDPTIAIEGGRMTADVTWDNTVTHLLRNSVYVPSGKTLTITAGSVIKFGEGTFIKVEDGGKLNVVGAAGQDVILTPANDTTVGAPVPGLGDETITYGGVWVQSGSATYTDNSYVQLRQFNYGNYPTVTLNDAVALRKNGGIYLALTLSGATRNQAFSIDWKATDDTAKLGQDYAVASGSVTWSKSGEGTKWIYIPLNTDEVAGESRTFTVSIDVARAVNVARGVATAQIDEYENAGLNGDEVTVTVGTESAAAPIQEDIAEQVLFLNDVETIQYSGRWQKYPAEEATKLRVSLATDNGVTVLKETTPDDTGAFDLTLADWPVGYYTLSHEVENDYGEVVATMSKSFSILDHEDYEWHAGTLTQNERWTADKVHVVYSTVYVPALYTLFVEPGAVVKFMTGAGIDISQGGAFFGDSIIFTHVNDDTIGGDVLSDGYTVAPPMDAYFLNGSFTFGDDTELRNITQKTALSGTISSDKKLSRGSVYRVSGTLTIASGATLTIPAGTVLKMESGATINVNSGATLKAEGTRAQPIIMTSIKDDSVGGDTNGDGNKTMPQPGDWHQIRVAGGTFNASNLSMLYLSNGNNQGGLFVTGGSATLDLCTIAHCKYDAMRSTGGTSYVVNSIFTDASIGVAPNGGYAEYVNCVFHSLTTAVRWPTGKFVNCIFSEVASVFFDSTGSTPIQNCVLWNPQGYGPQSVSVTGANGNIWGDPLFVDPMNGDFRIVEGSPCVDAADSIVAPEVDYYGQPRITMTEQEEGAELVGQLADIGICEVMPRDITSDIDLVPLSVRTASEAKIGELLFVKWEVQNVGGAEVSTAWRDTILLVSESGCTVALGDKVAGNQIVAGGTVFCSGYFTVPAIEEGTWYVKVNVNSYRDIFEGSLIQNNALTGDRPITLSLDALDANTTTEGVVNANTPKVLKFTYDEGDTNRMMTVKVPAGVKVTWGFDFVPQGVANSGSMIADANGATFRVPEDATDVYVVIESDTTAEYEVSTDSTQMVVTSVYPMTLPSSGKTTLTITGAGFDKASSIVLSTGGKDYAFESFVQNAMGNLVATVDCATLQAGAVYTLTVSDENNAVSLTNAISVTKAEGKGELVANLILPESARQGRIAVGYIEYTNVGTADMDAPIFKVMGWREGGQKTDIETALSTTIDGEFTGEILLVGISATHPAGLLKIGETNRIPFYYNVNSAFSLRLAAIDAQSTSTRDSIYPTWQSFSEAISDATTELNRFGECFDYNEIYRVAMRAGVGNVVTTLRGQVYSTISESPCANVTLQVFESNAVLLENITTNEDGYFEIKNLKVDETYTIVAKGKYQFSTNWCAKTASLGSVIFWVDPLGEFTCSVKGIAADNVNIVAVEVKTGQRVEADFENNLFNIKDLRDGEYTIGAEINGYYCLTDNYNVTVDDGVASISNVELEFVPSGVVVGTVLNEKGVPVPAVQCFVEREDDGKRYEFYSDENGQFIINVPSGVYIVRTETNYSLIKEYKITVVNQQISQKEFIVTPCPFMLKPAMGIAPFECSLKWKKEFNNYPEAISFEWDFDSDGVVDSIEESPKWTYTNAGVYDVTCNVTFVDGTQVFFAKKDAVDVLAEEIEILADDTVKLDKWSGWDIIDASDEYITVKFNEHCIASYLDVGTKIILPANPLSPYKILSLEKVEDDMLLLQVEPIFVELAYDTLAKTFSVELMADDNGFYNGGHTKSLTLSSEISKSFLNDKLTITGGASIGGTATVLIYEKKLEKCALNVEAKASLTGTFKVGTNLKKDDVKKKKNKKKKKKKNEDDDSRCTIAEKVILVGYVPIELKLYIFADCEISMSGSITTEATASVEAGYSKVKGWFSDAEGDASLADLSINGNASFFFGLGLDVIAGMPSTKLTKSVKLSALDGTFKVGPNFYVDIKYHPSEDEVADEYKIGADIKYEFTANLLNIKLWNFLDWKALTYTDERAWHIMMYTWKTPIPSFYCDEIYRGQNLSTVEFKRTTTVDPLETLFKSGYWEINGCEYPISTWNNQTVSHDFYIPSEDSADSVEYDVALYESYKPGNPLFSKLVLPACKANRTTLTFGTGKGEDGGAGWTGLGGHQGILPQSCDPNEMAGPLGIGDPETERFVKPGDWMTYTVYFENKSDATAAAQEVRVTNPLSQYLDWSTFEMGEVSFNNQIDLGLSGKQTGASEVALNNTAYKVKTTVALDQTKGEVNWYLRIVDPSTETTWPEDVYAGILPPNDETHRGEGYLTYRVKVREDVPAGVRIDNSATIIFDYNEPIETDPAWWNRVVPSQVPMSISPEATLVDEGETIEVKVFGGDLTRPSSAQVYLSYHTAAAADLDLAKATVTGVNQTAPSRTKLAFPLTLNWATGEVGEQTIRIPVKADKTVEDEETFTLQLANPENMALGSKQVCMVTLHDTNEKELKAAVTPYKPKPGESPVSHQVTVGRNDGAAGFVAGSGEYTAGSKLTLTAEARPGYAFVGWALKEDLENLLSTNPKYQIVVGEDGDYVAVFEPIPYVRGLATPAEGGKVTGSGYCADGKKVTLKASANKNFVFKGWYAASVENPQTPDEAVCVATTPSLVIDRTAKPTANSKTSTTLTDIDEDVTFFALFEGDPRLGLTMMPESAGKVTGAGRYLPGTKVTLKATPNKGYVFAGWYQDEAFTMPCESMLADYRNPSYTYVTGAADATLHACFVPAEEDQVLTLTVQNKVNDEIAETFTINGKAEFVLLVDSKSLPKATVTGLPTGMKFTATPVMVKGSKTEVEYPINTIYGTPTKPGVYTVTVSLTNSTIKKAITKTFEINVLNFTDDLIKVKDSYGPYVPGVSYTVEIPEAAGCTVTGLPTGMKWTAKDIIDLKTKEVTTPANSVYGIPTTPGNYTVYFTKTVDKVKHTATATFIVGPYPQLTVDVPVCTDGTIGGKVTGAGGFAANKKVTLRATPNKGYVFAGWYKDAFFETPCDSTIMDYRNPSYTYVMGDCDTQFYARFVTKEDEADYKMGIALYPLDAPTLEIDELVYKAGEAILPIWVMVDSLTLPKVTVKGLPKGMQFDAKTFTISGMPTQPGDYVVYIEAVNASKSCVAVAEFYFTITHYDAHGLHQDEEKVLMVAAFEAGEIVLDENFSDLLNSVSVKSFKLPSGLSYDSKTNSIKGNGTLKCGTYVATLTDTEGKVTSFTLVAELTDEDKFTYRNALSLNPEYAYGYEGIVQGVNAEVFWLEVLKSCDDFGGGSDVCLLDAEEAKALSIKVSGLPTGLKANFEKEYVEEWEGDEYVRDVYACDLWLEGKTSAAPGDYHVTVTITNSRTGQVEHVPSLIRIYPPQPIQTTWNASFSTEMVDEETGEVRNAHADVVYTIDGTSGSVTYSLTIDPSISNPTEKPITRSGKFSLWCIGVRENLDGETYYLYEFDHITMTTEVYAWININASHEIQSLHFDYWEERLSDVYDWVLWEWDDSPW